MNFKDRNALSWLLNYWRAFTHQGGSRLLILALLVVPLNASDGAVEYFEKFIRPVLVERCYECHSTGSKDIKGSLLLDFREGMLKGGASGEPILIPGEAARSLIIKAISHSSEDLAMPPRGEKLTQQQIDSFVTWIDTGAADPRSGEGLLTSQQAAATTHWAFQPPAAPSLPPVKSSAWPRNPIDHFILARLESEGLSHTILLLTSEPSFAAQHLISLAFRQRTKRWRLFCEITLRMHSPE